MSCAVVSWAGRQGSRLKAKRGYTEGEGERASSRPRLEVSVISRVLPQRAEIRCIIILVMSTIFVGGCTARKAQRRARERARTRVLALARAHGLALARATALATTGKFSATTRSGE